MAKIVLSYRRDDSGTVTNWLTEKLVERYGREAIFRDIDSIQPTENFRKRIGRALRDCDFVVAIVGPGWVGRCGDDGKARIHADNDWVRVEVETALQLDIPLLPVLVEGAEMPQPDALPASLREMTEINALPISSASSRFYDDLERLFAAIEKVTGAVPAAATGPASDAPQPAADAPQPVAAPPPAPPAAAPPPRPAPAPAAAAAAAPSPAPQSPGPAEAPARKRPVAKPDAERPYALTEVRTLLQFLVAPSLVMSVFWFYAFLTEGFGDNGLVVFFISVAFMMGLGLLMRNRGRMRAVDAIIVGGVVGVAALVAAFLTGDIRSDQEITLASGILIGGGIATTYAGFLLGRFVKLKWPAR